MANQAPVLGALSPVTVAEGSALQVTVTATDAELDPLTFSLVSPPAFASLSGSTITLSPNFTQSGSYMIQVRVTDGTTPVDGLLSVTVTNTNRAPTLTSIADVSMTAGTTQTITLVGADPDADPLTYSATNLPAFATISGAVLTLAPGLSVVSSTTVTASVSDGNLSASDSFLIVVSAPANQVPIVSGLSQVNASNTAVAAGASVFSAPKVRADIDDPENAQVRLEVEVALVASAFTNTATQSVSLRAEGQLEIVLNTLPAGTYKWQVRGIDAASAWVAFNNGAAAFTVLANPIVASVSISSGAAAVNTSTVTLTLSATSSGGSISFMAFSNDGVTFSANEAFATTKAGWALVSGEGNKTVFVRFTDSAMNTFVANDSVVVDTVAPQISSFVIAAAASFSTSANVTLTFTATDSGSGVTSRHASNDGSTFTAVTASPAAWTLSTGNGLKTVTLRITDAAGNQATTTDTITFDSVAPLVSSVSVNSGGAYTNSLAATVAVAVTDTGGSGPAEVCFSGDVAPSCAPYSVSGSYPVTLTSADGGKTVAVVVTDVAGNFSSSVSDGITLDRTPPSLSAMNLAMNATYTRTLGVNVQLVSPSDTNPLTQMEFSTDGVTFTAPITYAASSTFTLTAPDGLKTVHVRVIDAAGNRSPSRSDTITLDATGPIATLTAPRGTNQTTATIAISAPSDPSGVTHMCVKVTPVATAAVPPTGSTDTCFVTLSASAVVTVSTGGVSDKRVHVWLLDGALNVSATPATTDIFYDTTNPSAPSGLSAVASNHGLTLSWAAASDGATSGVAEYEAGLSKTPGGPYVYSSVGGGLSGFVTASNGVTWYVVLRAKDHAGNTSTASNQTSATPYWPWTWQQREPISVSFTNAEVVDAGTSARWVAAGEFGALYTSDDQLSTWTRRDALSDERYNGVATAAGSLYVLGQNGLIARSTDNAVSFSSEVLAADAGTPSFNDLAAVGSSGTTTSLAAVTTTGVILRQVITPTSRSIWTPVGRPVTQALRGIAGCAGASLGPCAGANSTFSIAVGNAGSVVRSTDSGQTWTVVTPPTGYGGVNFSSVLHRPASNEFYVSASTPGVGQSGLLVYDAQTAAFTPLTASATNELKLSMDGAFVWGFTGSGAFRFPVGTPSPQTFFSGGTGTTGAALSNLVAATFHTNGSHSLMTSVSGFVQQNGGVTAAFNAVATRAGLTSTAWAVGAGGTVRVTTDTGATWATENAGTTVNLAGVATVTTSAGTTYVTAVGPGATLARKRGANGWGLHPNSGTATNSAYTLYGVSCNAPATTSNTISCLAVGDFGTILSLTQDISVGDGTWSLAVVTGSNLVNYRAVHRYVTSSNNYRALVAGRNGLLRRFDGTTWLADVTLAGSPSINGLAGRHGTNSDTMACGDAGAIRYTTDHGVTWTSHNPVGYSGVNFKSCANVSGTNEWLVVGAGGVLLKGTWSSVSQTFSWAVLSPHTSVDLNSISTVQSAPGVAYVVGAAGTVLFTSSAGE